MKYFKLEDFKCPIGQEYPLDGMDERLLFLCDAIREACGFALDVTSGYRNPAYNAREDIGGEPDSQHLLGKAADLTPYYYSPERFLKLIDVVREFNPKGLGIYLDKKFVHVDVRHGYEAKWFK